MRDDGKGDVRYMVQAIRPCPECGGLGIVLHPWGQEVFDARGDEGVQAMSVDDIEDWFQEHGFDYAPDQEVTCHECRGDGEVYEAVTLREALGVLGVAMAEEGER